MMLPSAALLLQQMLLLLLLLRPNVAQQLIVQSGAPWPAGASDGARSGLSSATGPTVTSSTPLFKTLVPGCDNFAGSWRNYFAPGPVVDAAGDVCVLPETLIPRQSDPLFSYVPPPLLPCP